MKEDELNVAFSDMIVAIEAYAALYWEVHKSNMTRPRAYYSWQVNFGSSVAPVADLATRGNGELEGIL